MKALILAAGYATRLYPLTQNQAKPLLPVAGKPILNYILESLEKINSLDEIFIVTNAKFAPAFEAWASNTPSDKPIQVVNDGTTSDADKLGAIGDIHFVIEREKIKGPLLIVAGDNLYDTDLRDFVDFFESKGRYPCIAYYDIRHFEAARRFGIVEVDRNGCVTRFEEKPAQPRTTLAAAGLYLFPKEKIGLIGAYIKERRNLDAPGFYISWLVKKDKVYAFPLKGKWYDIGDFGSYEKANEELKIKS